MKQIKTTKIKLDAFPKTTKKLPVKSSKKDFMNQLETFLAKEKQAKKSKEDGKEVRKDTVDEEQEKHEDEKDVFEDLHRIQLFDFMLANQLTVNDQDAVTDLNVEQVTADFTKSVDLAQLETIFQSIDLDKDGELTLSEFVQGMNLEDFATLSQEELEGKLIDFRTQLSTILDEGRSESEALPLGREIVALTDEELVKFIETIATHEASEAEATVEGNDKSREMTTTSIFETKDVEIPSEKNEGEHSNSIRNLSNDKTNIGKVSKQAEPEETELEIENSIEEERTITSATEESGAELEILDGAEDFENDAVEFNRENIYHPSERTTSQQTNPTIKTVSQEDFMPNIETLMIEEATSSETAEGVTTAQIQLTPDHLGKVDMQIEMSGKELTARLLVEQKETKEWIDQQVAQLKEELLTQEITLKDFEVLVQEENLNDAFMSSEDNPFFKQKEKDSQARKEQQLVKKQSTEAPIQREVKEYSTRNGISILV